MRLVSCRTCHAPIWFGRTEKGRRMPVNRDQIAGGNIVLAEAGDTSDEPAIRVGRALALAYVSHFATCAQASEHRRRGPERRPGR